MEDEDIVSDDIEITKNIHNKWVKNYSYLFRDNDLWENTAKPHKIFESEKEIENVDIDDIIKRENELEKKAIKLDKKEAALKVKEESIKEEMKKIEEERAKLQIIIKEIQDREEAISKEEFKKSEIYNLMG